MTAAEPWHAAGQLYYPPADTMPDNYHDYAVQQYERQRPTASTDVLIAATLGLDDKTQANTAVVDRLVDETRTNTAAVDRLTAAIGRLETLVADHTATMRAFLAAQQQRAAEEAR